MKRILSKYPFLIVLVAVLLIGLPSLKMGWALVDDGKSAEISHLLSKSVSEFDFTSFWNNLLEPDSGRFRPTYWLYLWVTFLVGGKNVHIHYLFHLVVFILNSWFIYKLVGLSGYKKAGVLAALFFIFDWRLLENWYRLGPQEPLQIMLLLGSLYFYFVFRKKIKRKLLVYSFVFLAIAFFYKETSLAYIAIPLYLFFADAIGKAKRYLKYDALYLVFSFFLGVLARGYPSIVYSQKGYSSLYDISTSMIFNNLENYLVMLRSGYSPLLEILFAYFLIVFIIDTASGGLRKIENKYFFHGLWLVWFFSFFIIQLPWGFTIGRYLQIALIGLFIFFAINIRGFQEFIIEVMRKKEVIKRLDVYWFLGSFRVVLPLLVIVTFLYQTIMSINYIQWSLKISEFNKSFIQAIAKNTSSNGNVYLNADYINNPPLELYMEIDWHLDYLLDRSDIVYDYFPEHYKQKKGDVILYHTSEPLIPHEKLQENFNVRLVDSEAITVNSLVLTAPLGFYKESLNTCLYITKEGGGNYRVLDNYYSLASYSYSWDIYKVD